MQKIKTAVMDGKLVAKEIYSQIKTRLSKAKLKQPPKLVIILIGNDAASLIYIKQKIKACENLGFKYQLDHQMEADKLTTAEVVNLVNKYNRDKSVNGMIVQMPLPAHIDKAAVINAIDPAKDMDGLHPFNIGQTFLGREFEKLTPCTASGVIKMLEYYQVELVGKKVTVIGSGIIAGRPIAAMLTNRRATVSLCNSKTPDLAEYTKKADIIVSAVGSPGLIEANMIKPGAVIVDVGINRMNDGKIVGDADFDKLLGKVSLISPVPGGVGKLTVACLMNNLLKASLD